MYRKKSSVVTIDENNKLSSPILSMMHGMGSSDDFTKLQTQRFTNAFERAGVGNVRNFEAFSASFRGLDQNVANAARQLNAGTISTDEYQKVVKRATGGNAALAASLKGIAINMGAMLLVMVAIKGAMMIFDKLNVTAEEQQEIVDDLTEKVKGLKDEYNELSGNNNLTEAEKQKLDYLQRQLTVNEQIPKQEQKKLALSKLYGDGDIFSTGELKATGVDSETDSRIQNDIAQLEKIRQQIERNEANQSGNGIDYVYQKLARQEAYVEKEMPYLFLFLSLTPTSVYPVGRRIILN